MKNFKKAFMTINYAVVIVLIVLLLLHMMGIIQYDVAPVVPFACALSFAIQTVLSYREGNEQAFIGYLICFILFAVLCIDKIQQL